MELIVAQPTLVGAGPRSKTGKAPPNPQGVIGGSARIGGALGRLASDRSHTPQCPPGWAGPPMQPLGEGEISPPCAFLCSIVSMSLEPASKKNLGFGFLVI